MPVAQEPLVLLQSRAVFADHRGAPPAAAPRVRGQRDAVSVAGATAARVVASRAALPSGLNAPRSDPRLCVISTEYTTPIGARLCASVMFIKETAGWKKGGSAGYRRDLD